MKSALVIASIAASALALPSDTHVLHQKRDGVHAVAFTKREAVAAHETIPFEIALKQRNIQLAEDTLYDISNPKSRNYGKHLSKAEVVKMFAAEDAHIDSVKRWLVASGVDEKAIEVNPTKTWIRVDAPAHILERALKTKYHVYRSVRTGKDHVGADHYSLPNDIADKIDFVRPGISMIKARAADPPKNKPNAIKEQFVQLNSVQLQEIQDSMKTGAANGAVAPACAKYITPDCIAALYKIPKATESNSTNSLGIYESLGDVYSQEDLNNFFKNFAPWIPQNTGPNLDLINGATAPNPPESAGGESNLDFDMAYPIIYPQTTTLFQVATDAYYNIFGDWLSAIDPDYCSQDPLYNQHKMCGTFEPTNVVSISYGGPEDPTHPKDAHRECNEFMKLGLMGISIVVASGDAGVTDRAGYCQGPYHNIFVADDLCSCPYITAVGSTVLHDVTKAEVATDTFSSGGGFSNIFTRPAYQDAVVSNYLLRHNPGYFAYNTSEGNIPPNSGIYNRGGRGFPDVAALGDNGVVASNGGYYLSGGTSMSAPIVAAILNRVNEKRLSLGKGPIGFANPALYDMHNYQGTYNDVTVGDQRLGGYGSDRYPSACGNNGFSCVPGWDPVTGLGTPVYTQWEAYFVQL